MTVQEAIQLMKSRVETATELMGKGIDGKAYEDMEIAIECMEKQIPKKPKTDAEDWLCCRNCGETFSLFDYLKKRNRYCGNCGQKIDWSDRE